MKIIKNLILFTILSYCGIITTMNDKIIIFVDKYPKIKIPKNKETIDSLSKKLKQPDYLRKAKYKQKRLSTGQQGVMALKVGDASLSDKNGQITFPRRGHQKPVVNLLVTKGIQPVYIIAPTTVHNWMLDRSKPAKMYQFKLNIDTETGLYYIETIETSLREDSMIQLETIIIIADPETVFVPLGVTLSQYSANFILPNIYIKKNFDFSYNVLYTNSIKQYFDSVRGEYKAEELSIAKITTTS